MQTYRIVMKGLKPGVTPQEAEPQLAATFRIDLSQVRVLLARLPVKVKSALPHQRALQYQRAIEQAGADCVVEPDPAASPSPEPSMLRTTGGHAVIEDGVAISRFDCDRPAASEAGRLRQLTSWLAAQVRMVPPR